jgi:hypothetical protein
MPAPDSENSGNPGNYLKKTAARRLRWPADKGFTEEIKTLPPQEREGARRNMK